MKARQALLVALAAAVTLTSVAAAGPDAAKQRVAITTKGTAHPSGFGEFVLTPLHAGALKRDSGSESSVWSERVVMREGQRVAISDGVETLKGKRGSLTVRFRIEWVDGGNGYHPGTGTWKVTRGAGEYAGITGVDAVATYGSIAVPGAGAWRASSPFGKCAAQDGGGARSRAARSGGTSGRADFEQLKE